MALAPRTACLQLVLLLLPALAAAAGSSSSSSSSSASTVCPCVDGATRTCQLHVCGALVALYNATQGPQRPGDASPGWTAASRRGWQDAALQGCRAYLGLTEPGAAPQQPPRYCREFAGVVCCSSSRGGARAGASNSSRLACPFDHALTNVSLLINHANGSFNNPAIMASLLRLEACGLQHLGFPQGRMSGSLTAAWGGMTRLRVLVLSGNWLTGTIPPELGRMAALSELYLDNNYLLGTIPAQLSQLKQLTRLNLGSQSRLDSSSGGDLLDNIDNGRSGLHGSIPPGLAELPRLVELNLASNILSGTIPHPICRPGSPLQVLVLRRNELTGDGRSVEDCGSLVHLDLSLNHLTGRLPASRSWRSLTIYIANGNRFAGSLPASFYRLQQLVWLDVANNMISGSMNDAMGLMRYLQQLNMRNNSLSGTIPLGLFYQSSLRTVDLSLNKLTGTVGWSIGLATGLATLRLGSNKLTGPIPEELGLLSAFNTLDVLNTRMTGPGVQRSNSSRDSSVAPPRKLLRAWVQQGPAVAAAQGLLQHSKGSSSVSAGAVLQQQLSVVAARRAVQQHRQRFLQALAQQQQQQQQQPGRLAQLHAQTQHALQQLALALAREHSRDVHNVSSSRALLQDGDSAAQADAVVAADASNHHLPCWMALSSQLEPLSHAATTAGFAVAVNSQQQPMLPWLPMTGLSCPLIVRRGDGMSYPWPGGSNFPWLCPFAQPTYAQPSVDWLVDPVYYAYAQCTCVQGQRMESRYDESLGLDRRVCVDATRASMPRWAVALVSALSLLFGLVLLLLLLILSNRAWQQMRFRPKYVRRLELNKRRAKGAPGPGEFVSVVVTDIEGYSNLMSAEPRLTTAALGLHNNIIRKAQWANAGVVLEQEGDSYTVAFHRSLDAVAFCLQVQVGLHNADWRSLDDRSHYASTPVASAAPSSSAFSLSTAVAPVAGQARAAKRTPQQQQQQQQPFEAAPQADVNARSDGTAAAGLQDQQQAADSRQCRVLFDEQSVAAAGAGAGAGVAAVVASTPQQGQLGAPAPVGLPPVGSSPRWSSAFAWFGSPPSSNATPQHDSSDGGRRSSGGGGAQKQQDAGHAGSRRADSPGPLSTSNNARGWRWQRNNTASKPAPVVLASPFAAAQPSPGSSGMQQVSTGGSQVETSRSRFWQLLLPPASVSGDRAGVFNGLRVRMGVASGLLPADMDDIVSSWVVAKAKYVSDLGAGGQVLLDVASFTGVKDAAPELGCVDETGVNLNELDAAAWATLLCPWRGREAARAVPEAVLLDMGEYKLASPQQPPAPAAGAAADVSVAGGTAGLAGGGGGAADSGSFGGLRLYQVLHPSLVARAHVFGNDLASKEVEKTLDLPYFDAPGALFADLSAGMAGGSGRVHSVSRATPLPTITMVFARAEGGKQLMLRDKAEGAAANALLLAGLVSALRAVPGGYLCRVQDGEMKFMIAFYDPHDALEWCLVVQELLLWQPWSPKLLAQSAFREVLDADGQLPLFRGPRLKMGLCEGAPRAILPDHMGRADYHGATINQAARYMEVAAHGGQVVCDMALAARVTRIWRGEDPPPLHEVLWDSELAAAARSADSDSLLPTPCCYSSGWALQPQPLQLHGGAPAQPRTAVAGITAAAAAAGVGGPGNGPLMLQQEQQVLLEQQELVCQQLLQQLNGTTQQQQQPAGAAAAASAALAVPAAGSCDDLLGTSACSNTTEELGLAPGMAAALRHASTTGSEELDGALRGIQSANANALPIRFGRTSSSGLRRYSSGVSFQPSGASPGSCELLVASPPSEPAQTQLAASAAADVDSSSSSSSRQGQQARRAAAGGGGHQQAQRGAAAAVAAAGGQHAGSNSSGKTVRASSGSGRMVIQASDLLQAAAAPASAFDAAMARAALTMAPVQHRLALHLLQVEAAATSNRSRASKGTRLFGAHLLSHSRPRTAAVGRSELPVSPTSPGLAVHGGSMMPAAGGGGSGAQGALRTSEDGSGQVLRLAPAAAPAAGAGHGGGSAGQQQGRRASSDGGDEPGAGVPAAQLEVPTVAIRRRMLQSSCGKFLCQLGHEETRVEVRDIGLYKFKGTPEPLLMAAVSTARLGGRRYPDAAPLGKGCRLEVPSSTAVASTADVLLPQLPADVQAAKDAWLAANQLKQQQQLLPLESDAVVAGSSKPGSRAASDGSRPGSFVGRLRSWPSKPAPAGPGRSRLAGRAAAALLGSAAAGRLAGGAAGSSAGGKQHASGGGGGGGGLLRGFLLRRHSSLTERAVPPGAASMVRRSLPATLDVPPAAAAAAGG